MIKCKLNQLVPGHSRSLPEQNRQRGRTIKGWKVRDGERNRWVRYSIGSYFRMHLNER